MKRSKIIIELIKDDISVVQAMDILNILLEDIDDENIKSWLDNEINGYKDEKDIPKYRNVDASVIGTYLGGNMRTILTCTNQPIPIKPEFLDEFTNIKVDSGLNEILQLSIAEKESESHCLIMPAHTALVQQATMLNAQIVSANRTLSLYAYTNILNRLKSIVLKILTELEKKYGNLDDYYIDFSNKQIEKVVIQNITNIINDNSISIGNDNTIDGSNIGENNEN